MEEIINENPIEARILTLENMCYDLKETINSLEAVIHKNQTKENYLKTISYALAIKVIEDNKKALNILKDK